MAIVDYYRLSDKFGNTIYGKCSMCGVSSEQDSTLVNFSFNTTGMCLCGRCRPMVLMIFKAVAAEDEINNRRKLNVEG